MTLPYTELNRQLWPRTTEAAGYVIRPAKADDVASLDRLADEAHRPPGARDPAVRSWRGGTEEPSVVVAEHSRTGALHAAFGADPVRVCDQEGVPLTFGRVSTLLEHPASAQIDAPSLAIRCAWKHFDTFGGRNGQMVVYGAPSLEDLKLGRRAGAPGHALDLEVIRVENLLRLPRARFRDLYAGFPQLTVTESPPGDRITALYEKVRVDWGASTVRDADWYRWRYEQRPDHEYRFAIVPGDDGTPRALTVGCIAKPPLPRSFLLLDWVCEPYDYDAGLTLLRWAIDQAEAASCSEVATLLPDWTPWFTHLQWNGLTVHEAPWFTAAKAFLRARSGQWLRDRWFYTLGDLYLGSEGATP